ncbi:MAG TPA: type I methionyl aminopeptidase [Ktedonobacterales bacterium]|jgi:methionyl aminopeptidase
MAVILKSPKEIDRLRDAGRIVAQTYEVLRPHVVPGVTTADLDRLAYEFIVGQGAMPLYKGHGALLGGQGREPRPPFPATICTSINDVICHGIPSAREPLREGDIIGIDIGARYRGWCGDTCQTFTVGQVDERSRRLVDAARRSLEIGIEHADAGNRLGDIGAAIQAYAEGEGFGVVRELGGHGIGRQLWEEPHVLHHGTAGMGIKIVPGMVFTIEPMINIGGAETRLMPDQWAIRTADGSRSAQFEHMLAVTDRGVEILTLP